LVQAEVNIGLVGHVDHGKTTLTKSLSGVWTDRHSEEIKRGISIRLGYADCTFYKCPKCKEPDAYTTEPKCPKCGGEAKLLRKVSFVDAPGHETLIATMLSGAALMDGVVLVIAADEECPQPQTMEHLLAIQILGIDKVIVVQNKIDIVSKENAIENKKQIEKMLKEFGISAPIIPIAANYNANKDVVIAAIENFIPTSERDKTKHVKMFLARSFDVNKPGDYIEDLKGGVVGGTLVQGELKIDDEIEIRPGLKLVKQNQEIWEPIKTKVSSLSVGDEPLESVSPGGLIAVQTNLDPNLTKSDKLSGNVLGTPGSLPPVLKTVECQVNLIKGELAKKDYEVKINDALMLTVGTTNTLGVVKKQKDNKVELELKLPIVGAKSDRFAISKRIDMKWRLIGYGVID